MPGKAANSGVLGTSPPRLLLDTNIFLDLADGELTSSEERLLRVAAHRMPPLLWTCPIVFDELISHVRPEKEAGFAKYRDALDWMDRLCGNLGMAEDIPWALRRGVFADNLPDVDSLPIALNQVRREVIKAKRYEQVSPGILVTVTELRRVYSMRRARWVVWRARLQEAARVEPLPGPRPKDDWTIVADAVLEVSRELFRQEAPLWGEFRSAEDQKLAQREIIAFELSQLLKAQNPSGYNIEKHSGDYNDGWLCAYPAAGYTLVTEDARLRDALKQAGCKDPRVVSLADALTIAEAWLGA